MIMELPKKFNSPFVRIEDGSLIIHQLVRYEDLIYELTYAYKKKKCIYCGKKLKRNNSTLDHRYPRDTGGVSITNNLFPCCALCNSAKGNLTHEEYLKIRELVKKERKEYLKDIQRHNDAILKKKGFKLPRKWVTFEDIDSIQYRKPEYNFKGKQYHRIVEFYVKYRKLPRPIIVDKNNWLLDGYNIILFAHEFGMKQIPVIKLENVEVKI